LFYIARRRVWPMFIRIRWFCLDFAYIGVKRTFHICVSQSVLVIVSVFVSCSCICICLFSILVSYMLPHYVNPRTESCFSQKQFPTDQNVCLAHVQIYTIHLACSLNGNKQAMVSSMVTSSIGNIARFHTR